MKGGLSRRTRKLPDTRGDGGGRSRGCSVAVRPISARRGTLAIVVATTYRTSTMKDCRERRAAPQSGCFPPFATEAAPFHRGFLIDKLHDDCVTEVALMGLEPSKTKPRTAEAIRGKVRGVSALGAISRFVHDAARRHAGHALAVRFGIHCRVGRCRLFQSATSLRPDNRPDRRCR